MNGIHSNKIVAPDLASPRFKADPYPFYTLLRAEAPCGVRDAARPAGGVAGDPL
jgi:hypothetical protein